MNETRVSASDLARHLEEILRRVREDGESFIVEREGEAIAEIRPAAPPAEGFTAADFARLLTELPQLDESFADDLEAIQRAQGLMPPNPWGS